MRAPEGLWFGNHGARAFGLLHQPAVVSNRGVVFCNALGFEGLLSYRAYRHIADGICARGQWALRFDYDGEGDSAGGAWEPGRVDAWMASIDAAVGVLRARGVTDVRLVGFRMGAALACRYATTHDGISGLVLWTPCGQGAAYVREQKVRARLSAAARPSQPGRSQRFPPDSLEAVGFEFTGETLLDLAAIDLVADPFATCPAAVLVIDRDDAPPSVDLVRKFAEAHIPVDHVQMTAYEAFITDGEENAVLPWPTLHRITDWIAALPARAALAAVEAGPAPVESARLTVDDATADRMVPDGPVRDGVVEEQIWVDDRFFAICSRPAGRAPVRDASIVLFNTGSVNRIGPGRLYVTLARYWASLGFTVVRVDLGGAGDSLHVDPPTENKPLAPVRLAELRDVVTWVRRWAGNDHVVSAGMCSGAFNAFHAAIEGLEIDHLLLVNPGVFYLSSIDDVAASDERALHSAHTLTHGFLNGRRWREALRDREAFRRGLKSVRYLFGASAISGYRVLAVSTFRRAARRVGLPVKPPSELGGDLETMIARGVRVLLVFASSESSAAYFRRFGGKECAALLQGDRLDVVYIDGGDHVFSPPASREELVVQLTRYLARQYPLAYENRALEKTEHRSSDVQG